MAAEKAGRLRMSQDRWMGMVLLVSGQLSPDGLLEDQLRKKEVTSCRLVYLRGMLSGPVYHALKGGHAGPF